MAFFSNARNADKTLMLALLLLGASFFLLSCLSEKQSAKKINSQKEEVLAPPAVANDTTAAESEETPTPLGEQPGGFDDSDDDYNYQTKYREAESTPATSGVVKQIRAQLKAGAYRAVLRLTTARDNGEDYYLKTYYRGIAYFAMASQPQLYSLSERLNYAALAEELLLEVGSEANEDLLRAKGLLWYGVALDINREDLKSKRKAIGAFWNIQTTALKDTTVYNDSLLYAAEAYSKMGWYGVARNYYNKLAKADRNDLVYDYVDNRFYAPFEAAKRGKERLAQYLDGTHPSYR